MQKLMTKRQIEESKLPTRLEVYQERVKRNGLNQKQKKELYRLEKGFQGEQDVLNTISKYGQHHWKVLTNLWLYEFGNFEIDILLVTRTSLYTFEVKNYDGVFEYTNSQCLFEGDVISKNPISQAQKAAINFQNILKASGLNTSINGALIFTGSNSEVYIHNKINGLKICTKNQLRKYIRSIAANEKENLINGKSQINIQDLMRIIEKHGVEELYPAEIIAEPEKLKMKKGIMCAKCQTFNIDTSKSYLICDCGIHEPREMAIVRTICEYGLVYFERDLTSSEVHGFFENNLSKSTVKRYLKKHFTQYGSNRGSKYHNIAQPFDKILHNFSFEKPIYMRIDN